MLCNAYGWLETCKARSFHECEKNERLRSYSCCKWEGGEQRASGSSSAERRIWPQAPAVVKRANKLAAVLKGMPGVQKLVTLGPAIQLADLMLNVGEQEYLALLGPQ